MVQSGSEDHVLPRPVGALPEYASARSRQALADKLIDSFGLGEASAAAIANAVVDPAEVRKSIGEPDDPDVERIPVPGGTLLGIRTTVWARRTMPDPRNPRTLPSRKHPFAVEPGSGGEESIFRPVPDPRSLNDSDPAKAELAVDIESRSHLVWASQQAAAYVAAENNWRPSIESQGVMEAVWLAATTYRHADGSAPATTLTTVEGSSRDTAVHAILGVHSADVPYDDNDAMMRARIRKLNEAFDRGDRDSHVIVSLRCERIPALILVGFHAHNGGATSFPTAVKSMVALRHVDPPKPWGEGPENESLADEVLEELCRQSLISTAQRDYYAGSCTRAEARAASLPDDPVIRAAEIIRLFTNPDARFQEAMRIAITSQSTRKRRTSKLMNELATALILRAVPEDRSKLEQIRRNMRYAFGKSVHREPWKATRRTVEQLVSAALIEVTAAISTGNSDEVGPASLELAVRAAYPLVVSGRLHGDRNFTFYEQRDRRTPGEVLETMRHSAHGVYQLGQVLSDFASGAAPRAVDENGLIKLVADGSASQTVSDGILRGEFPPPGMAKAAKPGDTPTDHYNAAVETLSKAFSQLESAFAVLATVYGNDGQPLVESRGVEMRLSDAWRDLIRRVDEEIVVWARAYRRAYGTAPRSPEFGLSHESARERFDHFEDDESDDD